MDTCQTHQLNICKTNEISQLNIYKNQAALVVLGGPRDFPSLRVSNLLVAPGRETWVEVLLRNQKSKTSCTTKTIKMKITNIKDLKSALPDRRGINQTNLSQLMFDFRPRNLIVNYERGSILEMN